MVSIAVESHFHPLAKSSSSPRSPSQFSHPNLPPEDPSSRKITSSPFPSQTHTKGPTTARIPLEGSRITTTYYSQRHDERCQTGVEAKRSGIIVDFLERERTTRVRIVSELFYPRAANRERMEHKRIVAPVAVARRVIFSSASCGRSSASARVPSRSAVEIAAGRRQPVASGRLS